MKIFRNPIIILALASSSLFAKNSNQSQDLDKAISQGASLMQAGKYNEALPFFKKALEIQKQAKIVASVDSVTLMAVIGNIYIRNGDLNNALSANKKALDMAEKSFGTDHPNTAAILNSLGATYLTIGDFEKAVSILERSVAIFNKSKEPNCISEGSAYDLLGQTYEKMGRNEKALPFYEKALVLSEKTAGPDSPNLGVTLTHVAKIYTDMGNPVKALSLQERSLSINEKAVGPDHPATAESLGNLAGTYMAMENYQKAIPYLERALAICEKSYGPENPHTADAVGGLACAYLATEQYDKSLPLFERALIIREKAYGTNHPATADALCSLAINYRCMKIYDKALPLFERGLAIQENVLGPNHPDLALSAIGNACLAIGEYEKSLAVVKRALLIHEKSLGPEHPSSLDDNFLIAKLHSLKGSDLIVIREPLSKFYLGKEKQMYQILTMDEVTRLSWQKENIQNWMIDMLRSEQRTQFILRTKGVVIDSLLEDQVAVKRLGEDSPEKLELISARLRIGKLAFSTKKEDQEEVTRLKSRIDNLLSSAASQSDKFGRVRMASTITPDTVASALAQGGVLLEFVQFTDPKVKADAGRCYGALILGRDGESKFVRIDDAVGIDSSVLTLREAIAKGDEKSFADQQKLLSEKLWAPVAKSLPEGTKKLFIGPDGQLNFLSFAALPAQDGSFLAEHYDIAYVGSGRDLTRKVSATDSKAIALFADPIFDRQASTFSTNALALRSGEVDAFGKIVLPPLPGTKAEEAAVEDVAKTGGWNPEARLGEGASKSAIMDLKSPGILHLATHGFYLNTLPTNGADGERGMKVMEASEMPGRRPALPKIDPMHASGIALTGAQATLKAWSEGRVPDSKEDGILTAEEVGGLNLDGTWLVTLSACETGVGEARSGEGVFGLRRAFMIAGAQNLLMTLWPVSDEVTPKIMADFYREALATHDAAGSLAKVQRDWLVKLRNEKGLLAAVRDAGPFAMVVMAKQDSTFSSPSTATPMAAPETTASPSGSSVLPPTSVLTKTAAPAPSPTPTPGTTPSVTPCTTPNPAPSPTASPSDTPVLSDQAPLKKAA